jgi:cell division protein FtsQ
MPRMSATARPVVSRPATRPRGKKAVIPQDRLTARKLFWRRMKRSLKPGLWVMGGVSVLIVGSELFRSLPTVMPASRPVAVHHSGFGLAELAAGAGLRISKVEILGAQTTDKAELQAAIGVQTGEPSLGFSLAAVKQRVEQLGPVQSVTVERELPGTLIVNVTERAAYAIWQTGTGSKTKFVLIDKAGNVIADQDATAAKRREPGLLLLAGADAPQNAQSLMTELQAAPSVLSHVAAAERVAGLRWNLVLKNQTVVKLPATNESQAITQLASLQSAMQLLDRPVEVIDLRLPGRLVVRPYPAAAATPAKDDHT